MAATSHKTKMTYLYDCIRGPFNGMIYTGLMTMAILVAIRHHHAPDWAKSLIAGGESIGRLLTPIGLYVGFKIGSPTARVAALFMVITSIFLGLSALAPYLSFYAATIILSYIFLAQPPQLMLQIYSQNYSDSDRGSQVSTMFLLSTGVGSLFAFLVGKSLDIDFNFYHYLFGVIALCGIACAFAHSKIPSTPLKSLEAGNPWQNVSLLWKDQLFGLLTVGYIILGLGNSIAVPVRIEYMANTDYAINASNLQITLVSVVIPGICMILSTPFWGWIFDKMHFVKTRLIINTCFITSFLLFFLSTSFYAFSISAIFNGFALGGGMLVWHLWVTKVAPKGTAPAYMSAHGAFSGVKGIIAPFIGFSLIKHIGPMSVGIIASSLMAISCIIFLSVWKNERIK